MDIHPPVPVGRKGHQKRGDHRKRSINYATFQANRLKCNHHVRTAGQFHPPPDHLQIPKTHTSKLTAFRQSLSTFLLPRFSSECPGNPITTFVSTSRETAPISRLDLRWQLSASFLLNYSSPTGWWMKASPKVGCSTDNWLKQR